MDAGRSITPAAALIRNLAAYWTLLPHPVCPALITMFLHPSNKRRDLAGGHDRRAYRPRLGAWRRDGERIGGRRDRDRPPELSEDEFRLLIAFSAVERAQSGRPGPPHGRLVRRFETRIPRRNADPQGYLRHVFAEEQRKRRSRFARAAGGAAAVSPCGRRFVQKKRQGGNRRTTAVRMGAVRGWRTGARGDSGVCGPVPRGRRRSRPCAHVSSRSRVITYLERVSPQATTRCTGPVAKGARPCHTSCAISRCGRGVMQYVLLAFLLFAIPARRLPHDRDRPRWRRRSCRRHGRAREEAPRIRWKDEAMRRPARRIAPSRRVDSCRTTSTSRSARSSVG